jgi:hypothetical protein
MDHGRSPAQTRVTEFSTSTGALLGVVGALIAIPVAAAVLLLADEVLYPRLGRA